MTGHLLLTCDYEVFGGGQGDLDACVVRPTAAMLAVAESHDVPLTIFVDASELLAMRGVEDGVARAEAQLKAAARRGHAVQLHLHPQWDGAEKRDGRWVVDRSRWRIGGLAPDDIAAQLARGKAYLEDVAEASVDVFRAGAWAIQPEGDVLAALAEQGFRMESSVAPGRFLGAAHNGYDFRGAPRDAWWRIDRDVLVPSDGPLVEVPIATAWIGRRAHLAARRSRPATNPEGCTCTPEPISAADRAQTTIDQARNLGRSMLDFCGLDASAMASVQSAWTKGKDEDVPVVAIGHSKNFTDWTATQLDRWLAGCGLEPATYASWHERAVGP